MDYLKTNLDDYRSKIESTTTRLESFWSQRNDRMIADRDRVALVEPVKKQGFKQVVINEPKVLYYTCVALLSSHPPKFRIPISINVDDNEKNKMNMTERFLSGVFRELDNRNMDKGEDAWLRQLAYWICGGHVAVFPHIEVYDGKPEFWADLYDPITVYPMYGRRGLVKLVRSYQTYISNARDMASENNWDIEVEGVDNEIAKIVNYWDLFKVGNTYKVANSILIQGKFAKKPMVEDFTRIPIICMPVGGSPEKAYPTNWKELVGQSVISANYGMYDLTNDWLSMITQIAAEAAYPNVIDYNKSGKPKLKKEDMGYGKTIARLPDEKVELLKIASTPPELNNLLGIIGSYTQRGGLPYVLYGGLQFQLSGFAISQLMSAINYKIGPYMNTMAQVISRVSMELLTQFRSGSHKVELMVPDKTKMDKGMFYVEEYTPKDVPEVKFVQVEIPLDTPQDKNQMMMIAKQAITEPRLLSRETLWEDYLGVQDKKVEYERLMDDKVRDLPLFTGIDMLERMRAREYSERKSGNNILADVIKKYIMQIEMQMGLRQGIPETPGQGKAGGLPPSAMPPEFGIMGMNPDQLRANMGTPPPGLNRPSQAPMSQTNTGMPAEQMM